MSQASELGGAAILGILQGLTEFLPVSSSGHLVMVQQVIDVAGEDLIMDLVLHVATLLPALWFYRADVQRVVTDAVAGEGPWLERPGVRLAALVVVATIPTGLIGVLFEDLFESLFANPVAVGVAFAVTGGLLWSTRGRDEGTHDIASVPWITALAIGVAQGLAITPGISRSGATIATALLLGVRRDVAVKLSFLMSVPAILGAVVLKLGDAAAAPAGAIPPTPVLAVGFVAAMFTGYAALAWLVRLVQVGRFAAFAWYLWPLSVVAIGLSWAGGS